MDNEFKVAGTCLIIQVPQELDHHNAAIIREKADRIIERQNIKDVVFDFAETSFMDSSGIGVIMGRYKTIKFLGGTVSAVREIGRAHV